MVSSKVQAGPTCVDPATRRMELGLAKDVGIFIPMARVRGERWIPPMATGHLRLVNDGNIIIVFQIMGHRSATEALEAACAEFNISIPPTPSLVERMVRVGTGYMWEALGVYAKA